MLQLGPEGGFERKRLQRLIKLQQCDRSFFLLGCHSYIESWLRQHLHIWEYSSSFEDLIFKFKIALIEDRKAFPEELSVLQTLRIKEKTALAVRHSFVEISPEEATAATYRLTQFCSLAGIESGDQLEQINSGFGEWRQRRLITDDELEKLKDRLAKAVRDNKNLLTELEALRSARTSQLTGNRKITALEEEIRRLKAENYGGQADELVKKVSEAKRQQEETDRELRTLAPAEDYVTDLQRITAYTRTRLDFERDITRLSPEQQNVLDSISLTGDFLVKGGAGTGKTLVLIKALEKSIEQDQRELNFGESSMHVRMLTFNRTLAKYDRYLSELMEQRNENAAISTVDKFLYDKLRQINPDYRIVYSDTYLEELISEDLDTESVTAGKAVSEIEKFIFASNLTKEEYLESGRGLTAKELEDVWEIRQHLIDRMTKEGAFSKNYSRIVIIDHIGNNDSPAKLIDTDFSFIDEIQDLAAVDIRAVKACTKRSVVMAGDSDQSIYQEGFRFSRAGISIRGNTRILKTNFRNSDEIKRLSDAYRLQSESADTETGAEAFRNGPPPELFFAENSDLLPGLLCSRVRLFTGELSYDPENICILLPSSRDIEAVQNCLKKHGIESHDLRDSEFSFSERNVVRISTMHSSKGLDFPVVLLALHRLPQTSAATPRAQSRMRRNLIYVSMTRAMDHLNIFALEDEKSPEITGLTRLFK